MAHERTEPVQINDTDNQDVREMKMMRFIFSLPIGDITLLPRRERFCILCDKSYNPRWNITEKETAVVLPCGHFIGLFCIRKWLSPFEDGNIKCPIEGCGVEFPCPVDSTHCHQQTIVNGKLRPKKVERLLESETLVENGPGNKEGEEGETSEVDSVTTEEMMGQMLSDVGAKDIEDVSSSHEDTDDVSLTSSTEEDEVLSIIGSMECSQAADEEAEASEIRSLGNWPMVCKAIRTLWRCRGKGLLY